MALTVKPAASIGAGANKTVGTGINLSDIGNSLTKQKTAVVQMADATAAADARKVVITSAATQEQLAIGNQSLASQQDNIKQQLSVLDGVNGQLSKAKVAMALADSKNPMDRIKLWALQQSDPSYTREGNTARISYLQSAADALGGMEVLRQTAYQDQIKASQNNMAAALEPDNQMLAQMQIGITQGQTKIDAAVAASSTRLQMMQQQNSMQDAALSNLDEAGVANAKSQAMNSPNRTANVGGVEISMASIEARESALKDRTYTQYARDQTIQQAALADLTTADVDAKIAEAATSKTQTAVLDNGVSVSLARLQERKAGLVNQDTVMQSQTIEQDRMAKTMKDFGDRKVLETMSPTELNDMIVNGGVDPKRPTDRYSMDLLTDIRNTKAEAQQNQLKQQAVVAAIGDPQEALADFGRYIDTVQKYAPADSQLAKEISTKSQAAKWGANLITSNDPEQVAMGAQLMQGAREQIDAAIDNQAKISSNGDKDKEIALKYQYRGQAIPQEVIATALTNKLSKNQSVLGWLSPENATMFQRTYQQLKQDIAQENTMAGGLPMPKADIERMATEQALTTVMHNVSSGMTEDLLKSQLIVPGNPLAGAKLTTAQIMSMYRKADQDGLAKYKEIGHVSDEDMQKLITGEANDPQLDAAMAGEFYTSLEKIQPGLGKAYTDWWSGPARDQLVQTYSTYATQNAATSGFQKLAETSLVLPTLGDQMSSHAQAAQDGEGNYYATSLQNQHQQYVNFQGDAGAKQVFLLEQTPDLTPSEKQQAMTEIMTPLLKQVNEQKMPFDQASTFIETNLRSMRPEDPNTKKLLGKILANRDKALKVIDDFAASQGNVTPLGGLFGNILGVVGIPFNSAGRARGENATQAMTGFPWFQDWKKQQTGAK